MTNKGERSYSHWDGIVSTVSEFPLRQSPTVISATPSKHNASCFLLAMSSRAIYEKGVFNIFFRDI